MVRRAKRRRSDRPRKRGTGSAPIDELILAAVDETGLLRDGFDEYRGATGDPRYPASGVSAASRARQCRYDSWVFVTRC